MATSSKENSQNEDEEIPPAPPPGLRADYFRTSWSYVYWSVAMFVWGAMCIWYFARGYNNRGAHGENLIIAICLTLLTIAMITLPTVLFSGETWHKRLAWVTIILCLFDVLFIYPLVEGILSIIIRIRAGHYAGGIVFNDVIHGILVAMMMGLYGWSIVLSIRAVKLVKKLSRGEWGELEIKVG